MSGNLEQIASMYIEDGIVHLSFLKQIDIDIKLAEQLVDYRLELTKGQDHPLLVDIRNIKSTGHGVKEFMSGDKGTKAASAAAIIVEDMISRLIGNAFIAVKKKTTTKPARLFTSREAALKWLSKYRKNLD